jgi:phosphatidylglycerol lysyltransferase
VIDQDAPGFVGSAWRRLVSRIEMALVWSVAHGSAAWPFVMFAAVLALSWSQLRHIHPREVRAALGNFDGRWLVLAGVITAVNIAVMGLYDVIAFRHTRCRWQERWRNGAVAFAWSNFLTLGPLAGPAVRLWLYRGDVDELSELHGGIAAIAIAFVSGLVGWALATVLGGWTTALSGAGLNAMFGLAVASFLLVLGATTVARAVAQRFSGVTRPNVTFPGAVELAVVGWLDWLLAAGVFVACFQAAGAASAPLAQVRGFFVGQAIGVASLVPGGVGSSDAYWIARLPLPQSATTAVLLGYRTIYYVAPWALASLLLLARATRYAPRRLEVARRIVGGLVGGGGLLIILSSASPAVYARLLVMERVIPLQLVEASHVTAALAGLLLVVLARGLSRGYHAAFRATLILLTLASVAAILKGFDWEEALILACIAVAARSQAELFQRPSRGDWIERPDLVLAFAALTIFMTFGTFSHHVSARTFERWSNIGYRMESARFLRTGASMLLAVTAATLYVLLRAPSRFTRLSASEIDDALSQHAQVGHGTNALMVATGDKAVLHTSHGFCLYRTVGPYLMVFSDPSVRESHERGAFLDELSTAASDMDRRPAFYQVSLDWIPVLHDRGYNFFKLGEEAHVALADVTLEGHAGKMNRQVLRRAERDGVTFRILEPADVRPRMTELAEVSLAWLRAKKLAERQFSMGFFDEAYLSRFRCAVVEAGGPGGRIMAFANLLEGPRREELSMDLMRHRPDGPQVMDFVIVSLLLEGKRLGYQTFNLGMAPLASVGTERGAHMRERLARLLFQRGEQWYNFQGLRFFKDKYHPEWRPRYMAYQNAWEWPVVIAHASALIAGGWTRILMPPGDAARTHAPSNSGVSPPSSDTGIGGDMPHVSPAPP